MKNIKTITGIFLILISSVVSGQEELDRYLQIAAENNPSLKAKFNEYMAALEVAPQVKGLPDPQVAFGYFIMPVETRVGPQQFKISASQMFPWFGTLGAKEDAAVQAAKAKYEVFEETKSKLFHEVRATYYNAYFNHKAIAITLENIEILHSFRKLANIKFESGLVSAVDEYRIEIELGEVENQLTLLKEKQGVLEVMFNNLINVNRNEPIIIPELLKGEDFLISKQAAMDSVNLLNHQLLNLDFQQASLQFRQEATSDMGKPSFRIGLDYTFVGKGKNNLAGTDAFMFPSIGMTIPLYRNKYKSMINEVVYLAEAKEFEKADKINKLETVFENGWTDFMDANRRIDLYNSQLELARKAVKLLETDYATGNKNFEEILRMERLLLKFNLELEKARSDKQAAISFINYLMGK